jgi:hypothetical protein
VSDNDKPSAPGTVPGPQRVVPLKIPPEEFIVPAQDSKGHSAPISFRVPPGFLRELEEFMTEGREFGWKTNSDFYRWAVWHGMRWAARKLGNQRILNRMAIADDGLKALQHETARIQVQDTLAEMEKMVRDLLSVRAYLPIHRALVEARGHLTKIDDEYWREHWLREFDVKFGHHLRSAKLLGEEGEE